MTLHDTFVPLGVVVTVVAKERKAKADPQHAQERLKRVEKAQWQQLANHFDKSEF